MNKLRNKVSTFLTYSFFLFSLIILNACINLSDPNDEDEPDDISDLDLNLSTDEYPRSGTILGTLSSSLEGSVEYNLVSETVSGAIAIINQEVTVADWLVYDYESRASIEATIEASNAEDQTQVINVSISITDVDDIWAFLTDSRNAYEQAGTGEWISIIESEYNDLANYLAETTKSGATDSHLSSTSGISSHHGNVTVANDNGNTLPAGSYLFAFKYYSWANNVVSSTIKISQGDSGGLYETVGSTLPEHNDEFNFFVLKGANTPLSSEGYIGMYASVNPGWKSASGNRYLWRNGNVDNLDNAASDHVYLHQGLSSTLKQWD